MIKNIISGSLWEALVLEVGLVFQGSCSRLFSKKLKVAIGKQMFSWVESFFLKLCTSLMLRSFHMLIFKAAVFMREKWKCIHFKWMLKLLISNTFIHIPH